MFLSLPPTTLGRFPATFPHSWIVRPWWTSDFQALQRPPYKYLVCVAIQRSQVTSNASAVRPRCERQELAHPG